MSRLQNAVTYVAEWAKLNPKKTIYVLTAILLLLLLDGRAWAQEIRWNEDKIDWTPPTQCADGSPLTDCPTTGYRIETASSPTATDWTVVTTVDASVTTYKTTGLSAGQHCYRIITLSQDRESVPSNVACDLASAPAPAPATLETIDTVAHEVGYDWRKFRFVLGNPIGTVPLGTKCHETFRIKGTNYYQVNREHVSFDKRSSSAVIVAKCVA